MSPWHHHNFFPICLTPPEKRLEPFICMFWPAHKKVKIYVFNSLNTNSIIGNNLVDCA